MSKKLSTYPIVITRGLVVFPDIATSIDAVRPITLEAVNHAQINDGFIYVTTQLDPKNDNPGFDDVYKVGTLCRITSITQMKDFVRVKIIPLNRALFHKVYFNEENTFQVAEAENLDKSSDKQVEDQQLAVQLIKDLVEYPDVIASLPKSVINQLTKNGVSAVTLCDTLAFHLPMPVEIRQQVLESVNINERLGVIMAIIEEGRDHADIERSIQERVKKSTEKSHKDYILREKLKAIRTELGEEDDSESGDDKIFERLDKENYPQMIKDKVRTEMKRYRAMPQASLEASLIKAYVDCLMSLPWTNKTEDNDNLKNARIVLDEDHYGLEQVKERIVEYLAVKSMTKSLKAPILCFYGPPGVGKTSLGKSIARALGRKFHKVALGGISDEAEIRGHRRTYVGAMPGRIIAGMKKCGVTNPVFLLDEIDKVTSNQRGDPASALLEVLDPEQNSAFNDNYVEEPYDLSNVLFIATANYIENVSGPLRDRLELIEVNSYTEIEKMEIAKRHLIDKQLELSGLKREQIEISDDALRFTIEHYTRESGVRELERKIATMLRKAVVELLTNTKKKVIKIDAKKAKEYLGIEKFEDTRKDKEDQIGVVTGLAYTQYGGSILPIEVNTFPGKGRLILTGKLGDVMKESASIALDYVRANAEKYKIDATIFEANDTHIHVPEGAVPKDGPSAGIAITTAIISCFSKTPVLSNVAMTGEVTLRGNALAIGGLREKSLAALRSGIDTIIVPKENEKSIQELPEEVKKSLNIVYMNNVDDALKVALRGFNA